MTFRLTVDARGRVTLGEVVTSTLGGDDAEMCMIRATRDFKFPAGGRRVDRQLPDEFRAVTAGGGAAATGGRSRPS